ncbi:MAG TPA: hypothetical protein VH816_17815 [Gaiellaceae bacterium]
MHLRVVLIAVAACLGLAALTALLLDWSFGKAVILSPVIVLVAGAAGFLVVLWTRIIVDTFRGRRGGA